MIEALGGECVDCGTVDDLQFDHVDPTSKAFEVSTAIDSRPRTQVWEELRKCVLRCESCHIVKSRREGSFHNVEHAGGLTGKRGCKCQPCRQQKAEYMRQRRARINGKPVQRQVPPLVRLETEHGTTVGYHLEARLKLEHCGPCLRARAEYTRMRRSSQAE